MAQSDKSDFHDFPPILFPPLSRLEARMAMAKMLRKVSRQKTKPPAAQLSEAGGWL
jgi:hypothetical protein